MPLCIQLNFVFEKFSIEMYVLIVDLKIVLDWL